MAVKPKPRPKPRSTRTRVGKPPTDHEAASNKQNLPMLRTSERRDFKRCPQRWNWAWEQGLRPSGPPDVKLWFGTGWHLVMAHLYGRKGKLRGKEPLRVWREYVDEDMPKIRVNLTGVGDYREEVYIDAGALGEEMIGNYLDRWSVQGKLDPHWEMVVVEKPFEVIIAGADGRSRVLFCGTYDGVYRDARDGTLWLLEHKTAKSISVGHLAMDDQAGGYLAIAAQELANEGLAKRGEQIKGIMYNFVRKAPADPRPINEDGLYTNNPTKSDYLEQLVGADVGMTLKQLEAMAQQDGVVVLGQPSKNQPAPLFQREPIRRTRGERNGILQQIQNEVQVMSAFRDGTLPLYKNSTRDCKWDCAFYEMCILHSSDGTDWEEFRDYQFHTEDPYADHRKSAAGEEAM